MPGAVSGLPQWMQKRFEALLIAPQDGQVFDAASGLPPAGKGTYGS
jgi:hypothetical protein